MAGLGTVSECEVGWYRNDGKRSGRSERAWKGTEGLLFG